MHVVYLHGFASSADSSKGRFFAERLAESDVGVIRPDLNEPDFSTITVSRMIGRAEAAVAPLNGRVVLIGSSLGGLVAWHVAARAEARGIPVDRLVLLAPAFDFGLGPMPDLGEDGLARWRETGWHEFFHHAYGGPRRVHYALYEDARKYDAFSARVSAPTLAFQGRADVVVDPAMVARFAAARPNVTLRLLEDDHQLHASLGAIWSDTSAFLGLRSG